jgi:hypothetical protein
MGKSSKQTTTSVNQRLPDGMEAANTAAYQAGLDAAKNFDVQVYDGKRVADMDGLTLDAIDLISQLKNTPSYITGAQDTVSGLLGSDSSAIKTLTRLSNDQSSPYLQTMLDTAIGDATNDATSTYAGSGRLGSAAFGNALGRGVTDAAAPILQENLQADLDRQLNAATGLADVQLTAAGMADEMLGLTGTVAGLLSDAGKVSSDYEQSLLDADMSFINELNSAELTELNALMQAAGLASSNFTTTGTETSTYKPGLLDYVTAAGSLAGGLGDMGYGKKAPSSGGTTP